MGQPQEKQGPITPRLLRFRDASRYLGMDRNRFYVEGRPHVTQIPIGRQGIAFDRLELDAWVEDYKSRNGRPASHLRGVKIMGRKRIPGLRGRAGIWHIEKQIFGRKIHESTGTGELKTAELVLARRIEEARMATMFGVRAKRTFREAATRFLEENLALRSIGD